MPNAKCRMPNGITNMNETKQRELFTTPEILLLIVVTIAAIGVEFVITHLLFNVSDFVGSVMPLVIAWMLLFRKSSRDEQDWNWALRQSAFGLIAIASGVVMVNISLMLLPDSLPSMLVQAISSFVGVFTTCITIRFTTWPFEERSPNAKRELVLAALLGVMFTLTNSIFEFLNR